MNIQQMMKQAQQMQERLQRELAETDIEATVGGGMVTVVMNGVKQVRAITIDPEVVSKDDIEMLQDRIVAAINDAQRKVDEAVAGKMGGMMGGLNIPGLNGGKRSYHSAYLSNNYNDYPASALRVHSGSPSIF